MSRSKLDNLRSIHKHDLRNHYYLVNFNAKEAVGIVKTYFNNGHKILVHDDYGKTGIEFYLKNNLIPFKWFNDSIPLGSPTIILTNNKREIEETLIKKKVSYSRKTKGDQQYSIYIVE
jgi:hypothetical protein